VIPVCLTIACFLSYAEQVEIDFRDLSLACISGMNGAGKSTLLDAITWALFGKARRQDDSLINSQSDQATVNLVFDYESNRYKVQRIKSRNKSTLLEYAIQSPQGEWKPLTEATMTRTEQAIENTLRMNFETFTNASFFLQGKADEFAQQNPANRKRILGSILNLDQWETYRERVIFKRNDLKSKQNLIEQEISQIEAELSERVSRQKEEQRLEKECAVTSEQRTSHEISLKSIQQKSALLEQKKERVLSLQNQLDSLVARIYQTEEILHQRKQEEEDFRSSLEKKKAIETEYAEYLEKGEQQNAFNIMEGKAHRLELQQRELEFRVNQEKAVLLKELEGLEKNQNGMAKALNDRDVLRKNFEKVNHELTLLEEKISASEGLEPRMTKVKEDLVGIQVENNRLRREMDEIKEDLNTIETTRQPQCPLCGQALSAQHRKKLVTDLKKKGKDMGDHFRENEEIRNHLQGEIKILESNLSENKVANENRNKLNKQLAQLETLANSANEKIQDWEKNQHPRIQELAQLLKSDQFAKASREKLSELETQIQDLGYNREEHEQLQRELESRKPIETQKKNLDKACAVIEPLRREIQETTKRLQADEATQKELIAEINHKQREIEKDEASLPDMSLMEEKVNRLREKESQLLMEFGAVKQRVAVLKNLDDREKELVRSKEEILRKALLLSTLDRAFSRDGIPALLIEQALPEIELRANEILDRLSSGSMSVRFETQKDYKDKKREDRKETLDIIISDASGPRDYELFSGGEAFRVNFAIRLALSHLLAQRAGARLRTLVIDEGFGSQDSDGRQRLIEAINLIRPDFEKILIITHLEELKDAFPSRIEVEKTSKGSQVKVVNG
jgi:exonuclease SbcC